MIFPIKFDNIYRILFVIKDSWGKFFWAKLSVKKNRIKIFEIKLHLISKFQLQLLYYYNLTIKKQFLNIKILTTEIITIVFS